MNRSAHVAPVGNHPARANRQIKPIEDSSGQSKENRARDSEGSMGKRRSPQNRSCARPLTITFQPCHAPHIQEPHPRLPLPDPLGDGQGRIDMAARATAREDDPRLARRHPAPPPRQKPATPERQHPNDHDIPDTVHQYLLFSILKGRPKLPALVRNRFHPQNHVKTHDQPLRPSLTFHSSLTPQHSLDFLPGNTPGAHQPGDR